MNPEKKELYTAKRSSGLDTSTDSRVEENLANFKANDDNRLIILTLDKSKLTFHAISSSVKSLCEHHSEESIFYVALKAKICGRMKVFVFCYIGEAVGGMARGKASMYKSAVFNLIDNHGEISAAQESLKDVDFTKIKEEIGRLQGVGMSEVDLGM